MDENCLNGLHGDEPPESELDHGCKNFNYSYDCLKDLDPDEANRIHPNDHRKVNQYLRLYAVLVFFLANFFKERPWRIKHCRGFYYFLRGNDALGANITPNNAAQRIDTLKTSFEIANGKETIT